MLLATIGQADRTPPVDHNRDALHRDYPSFVSLSADQRQDLARLQRFELLKGLAIGGAAVGLLALLVRR